MFNVSGYNRAVFIKLATGARSFVIVLFERRAGWSEKIPDPENTSTHV